MTYLDNLLLTTFSTMVAESEAHQNAHLLRIAASGDERERDGLRAELEAALGDPKFDWEDLLERHEVDRAPGEDARRFVVDHIWTPLFGTAEVPGERVV